jgi:hypothetical protein
MRARSSGALRLEVRARIIEQLFLASCALCSQQGVETEGGEGQEAAAATVIHARPGKVPRSQIIHVTRES